jgi:hypothetical protein
LEKIEEQQWMRFVDLAGLAEAARGSVFLYNELCHGLDQYRLSMPETSALLLISSSGE